jgi:DNA polymerase-3 subunit epsilon
MKRQVVLDTETTGLDPKAGHRLIEIGCVEIVNRRITERTYHQYINPEREIDAGAVAVHGIEYEQLKDEPKFAEVAERFIEFVRGAEVIIHNAAFDQGFIDHELGLLDAGLGGLGDYCEVVDSLGLARQMHPGQRNTLDALCTRYNINNARRVLHGALLDAEILAEVYLAMTGGQTDLSLEEEGDVEGAGPELSVGGESTVAVPGKIVRASADELAAHAAYLEFMAAHHTAPAPWPGSADAGESGRA